MRRLFLALSMMSTPVAAQSDTSAVPRELANVLAAMSSGAHEARISVAKAPSGFPVSLLPAGSPILGGYERLGATREPVTFTVIVREDAEDDLLDRLRRHVLDRGWAPPPNPRSGGFESHDGWGENTTWCRDSAAVFARPLRQAGGSFLAVTYQHARSSFCAMPERMRRGPAVYDIPLPVLRPPPGLKTSRGSGGASNDYRESRLVGQGAFSPSALVEYFQPQLVADGWAVRSPVRDSLLSVVTFQKRNEKGEEMHGLLTIANFGAMLDMMVRVTIPTREP